MNLIGLPVGEPYPPYVSLTRDERPHWPRT